MIRMRDVGNNELFAIFRVHQKAYIIDWLTDS